MDESKLAVAFTRCMGLASNRPRIQRIAAYLSELHCDPAWNSEELAELQRRVLVSLADAENMEEVL